MKRHIGTSICSAMTVLFGLPGLISILGYQTMNIVILILLTLITFTIIYIWQSHDVYREYSKVNVENEKLISDNKKYFENIGQLRKNNEGLIDERKDYRTKIEYLKEENMKLRIELLSYKRSE